jgi:hypothetical protein
MLVGLVSPISAGASEWLGLTGIELRMKYNTYALPVPLRRCRTLGQGWVNAIGWIGRISC